jgi:UDP-N-acetylmuramoylalanine--D-glutamate ligase
LELSSFQLETTHTLNAYASTVLNISPDHMDRYDRLGDYVDAKLRVYRGDGFKVINRDETGDWLQLVRNSTPRDKIISFGLDSPAAGEFGLRQIKDKQWLSYGDENIVTAEQLKISGTHNISNALAALALGKAMGFSIEAMLPGLIAYAGLPHRTQWVACENGVNWYNDSKGTNVGATIAAIQGFSGEKILIAGGVGKGADFHQLDATIRNHKVMHVVLYGHDAKLIENDLGSDISISHANSLIQAVEIAKILSKPGWLVLFSPACASFDMFENYEKRGEAFVAAVKQVTKCH